MTTKKAKNGLTVADNAIIPNEVNIKPTPAMQHVAPDDGSMSFSLLSML
jgi:hypothetical protein